jgi:hypothetical protein
MQVSILYEIAHLTLFTFSPSLVVCCFTNLTRPSRLSRVEWWECDGLFPYAWASFYGKGHGTAIYSVWDCGRASVQTSETTTMGILFVRNSVIPNLRAGKPTSVNRLCTLCKAYFWILLKYHNFRRKETPLLRESTFIMPRGGVDEDVKGGGTEIFSGIKGGGGSESSRHTEGGGSKLFKVLTPANSS